MTDLATRTFGRYRVNFRRGGFTIVDLENDREVTRKGRTHSIGLIREVIATIRARRNPEETVKRHFRWTRVKVIGGMVFRTIIVTTLTAPFGEFFADGLATLFLGNDARHNPPPASYVEERINIAHRRVEPQRFIVVMMDDPPPPGP